MRVPGVLVGFVVSVAVFPVLDVDAVGQIPGGNRARPPVRRPLNLSRKVPDRSVPTPPRNKDTKKFKKSSGNPSDGTGAAGRGRAALRPSPAILRSAKKSLGILLGRRRISRTEVSRGSITVVDKDLVRKAFPFELALLSDRRGGASLLLRHGRAGDVPDLGCFGVLNGGVIRSWWNFAPESRGRGTAGPVRSETIPTHMLGALEYQDLLPFRPEPRTAKYVRSETVEGRAAHRFAFEGIPGRDRIEILVPTGHNCIVEMLHTDFGGRIKRRITFDGLRLFGVHKRWTRWMIQDLDTGTLTLVRFDHVRINRGIKSGVFAADQLVGWYGSRARPSLSTGGRRLKRD